MAGLRRLGVVSARDAAPLAASRGATVVWDDDAQEAHFRHLDDAGKARTVWFENSYRQGKGAAASYSGGEGRDPHGDIR